MTPVACDILQEERIDNSLKHPAYTARQEELSSDPVGVLLFKSRTE